jgi:signal peptidase I
MRTRYTRKLLTGALGLIVLGSLWFWFAPIPLGGSTTYVVTHGISMEPRFHTGDLAIVRAQSSYHVGEIVAYQNRMLHTVVLHRIVGREGGRYLFKGDHNNFVDFEHPAASQLIGALWLHIPGVGADLQSIRSPALIGALVAVGVLLLTGAAFARRRRLRRRERRGGEGAQPPSPHLPRNPATPVAAVLTVGLLLALPFLLLALLAFTRSPTAQRPYTVPYTQSGKLSYTAETPAGPTYPEGKATTGDPLFTRVVKAVEFTFGYRLDAAGRRTLGGTASLDAIVASTDGWQRTIELAPPTRFHGSHAQVAGTLDLTSLLALIHSVQTTTKVSGSYTLTLVPHVTANGSLDALPLHAKFAPQVKFSLTEFEAEPIVGGSSAAASPTGEQPAEGPFAPTVPGSATGKHAEPATLALGIATLSVTTARKVALVAIASILALVLATLACLGLLQALLASSRPRDEAASIRAKYGRFIVPVARVWQLPGVPVIDVEDMEALVQIAEHYDRSILHETAEDGEAFWVTDESGQFRYALGAWASAADGEPVDQFAGETRVHEVYADELEPEGAIAAYETQPADETFAADAVTQGDWTPRRDSGRGRAGKPRLA